MRILWLDPFHGGSHAAISTGYAAHSQHTVKLLTLSQAGGWRWRMRGAAVTFARQLHALANSQHLRAQFDVLVTTDMLDLATLLGLTRTITHGLPTVVYIHENQLTYPVPAGRKPDLSLPWLNYTSALIADSVLFNSNFHRNAFLHALPSLLARYHDHTETDLIATIAAKSHVCYPGLDLASLPPCPPAPLPGAATTPLLTLPPPCPSAPVILWNARWEYDKQPHVFFHALHVLEQRGIDFRLVVLGEHIDPQEPNFVAAHARYADRALAWGYAPDRATYAALLRQSDIVVSAATQEFFGISILEAIACGCVPLLPNRLSYPELIPPEHHATCLYDDDAALPDALARTIAALPSLKTVDWPAIAAPYGWEHAAARFDALIDRVASSLSRE